MNALLEKMKKSSTIKRSDVLSQSEVLTDKECIQTEVPFMNVALGGHFDGGVMAGLTVLAGPSKHFKTLFALVMASAFQKKYKDGIVLFYDSEFGTPPAYFSSLSMDTSRIFHTPITDIEELKSDIMNQLKEFKKTDKVFIVIDSVGNLASKKEIDDALDGKTVTDMTRAKAMKSLFRMITPHLTLKDIPLVAINHTYQTLELYSKSIVSGGTGVTYSADNIWIIGRQQEKDGDELIGWNFVINVEKSRYSKEKSKIPITVTYANGIDKWSGFLDNALESGHISKNTTTKPHKYFLIDQETGEVGEEGYPLKDIPDTVWKNLLKDDKFIAFVKAKYSTDTEATLMKKED